MVQKEILVKIAENEEAKAEAKASQQPIRMRRRTTPPRRSMLTCEAMKKEPKPQQSPFLQTTTRMQMRE